MRGPYTQQEELDILARHGALFPGACWRYSNSGYRLLGAIIARVTGRPWQDEIQARVIDRLGLRHMRVVTDAASLVGVAPPSTADGSRRWTWPSPARPARCSRPPPTWSVSSRRCWMGSC